MSKTTPSHHTKIAVQTTRYLHILCTVWVLRGSVTKTADEHQLQYGGARLLPWDRAERMQCRYPGSPMETPRTRAIAPTKQCVCRPVSCLQYKDV